MRGYIPLAIVLVVFNVPLQSALHSWGWFFASAIAQAALLGLMVFGRGEKRDVTPQELADELERHLIGNEGPYDWDATTPVAVADERLNLLIPRLIEYDRLDTAEKREEFRKIIDALRRGEIPD